MDVSLLDVLQGHFADGLPVGEADHGEEVRIRSVLANLQRLLNARRGAVGHLPAYGLPDISEVYRDMPDSIAILQQAIRETIETYEPRLARVRVEHRSADRAAMRLVFLISAELTGGARVRFETTFSTTAAAEVSPWQPT